MKLQEVQNSKPKGKWYYTYRLNLPKYLINELKWKKGIELRISTKKNTLILKPLNKKVNQ